MSKIKQLPPHEAQKIAAGEVVERPANIIKELVENSLDAGATTISVYVKDGGKELIRVVDDGCGMDAPDARLCFAKHATSKITHVDDLEKINTFGFRGEALATVAAVARVVLVTKEQDTQEGIQISIAQNQITDEQPVPANTGTDIAVHELFYAIPARKKFLKARDTEWRHIAHLMQAFCLDYPAIHFKLFSEGKQVFNYAAANSLADRCAQLWQQTDTVTINAQREDKSVAIAGIISSHQQYRYDRNGIFLFVNKRWIKDFKLTNALIKGYMNVIPQGRYPYACISITIDPTLVDINIHPRKEEVRFFNPRVVEKLIQDTVKQALETNLSAHIGRDVTIDQKMEHAFALPFPQSKPRTFTPYDFENENVKSTKNTFFDRKNFSALDYTPDLSMLPTADLKDKNINTYGPNSVLTSEGQSNSDNTTIDYNLRTELSPQDFGAHFLPMQPNTQTQQEYQETNPSSVQQNLQPHIQNSINQESIEPADHVNIVGQYRNTYILIEQKDGLFLVDQHAAHERVLYELFSEKFKDVATVNLLFPEIITLPPQDFMIIEKHLEIFIKNGIMIEPFGENQFIVQSTPVHFKNQSCQELVKQVIGWIHENETIEHTLFLKKIHEKLHAQMACKAAVKGGDPLSMQQMQQILTDLHKSTNRFACPHGRPTGWLLSLHDIEKKFKRKL